MSETPTRSLTAKFGDRFSNNWTDDRHPHHIGMFVRAVRVRGRMNPGLWWELTDGKGEFWQLKPESLTLVDRAPVEINTPAVRQLMSDLLHDKLREVGVHDGSIAHIVGAVFALMNQASAGVAGPDVTA